MRVGAQRLQAVELKIVLTFLATVQKRLSVKGVPTHVERFH